jgi:predicted RNA-binding Zn ribbon-like protein
VGIVDAAAANALRNVKAKRGEVALRRAKSLREALYRIFGTRPVAASDLEHLQRELRAAQKMRILMPEADHFAWRWRPNDPDTITHRIAELAADLLTSSRLGRVHVCPGENCAWLFLDTSRSGRRVWCSDEACGNRDRVRRWRDRHQHT